ncbi:hypothetical protein [Sphingomonas sp. 28-63-12]|uniref:hypothetical protein n=1 Tax=Sphingomonas sp. 28-63-12 TaxID=1970434 RepID=UPI000BC53517|nr:MAG: hypothetical protein B7Y47_01850 [Sphingomonas sp. 28-63-12]
MKTSLLIAAAALLVFPLAACDQKPEVVTSQAPDPQADALAKAPKIVLPPSIKATVTFRCKDNSLAFVDFFSGDTQVNLRGSREATPIKLTAEKAGGPFVADGYSLSGTPEAITLAQPGKPSQACKK